MFIRSSRSIVLAALAVFCVGTDVASAAEKDGWSWKKLNPFHIDDTKSIRPAASRKIAPNRFKPTRSVAKPKQSVWKSVGDGTKKMVDGTKRLFTFGDSDKPAIERRSPPSLKREPAKKKTSYTSWLPWNKTKKR